MPHSPTRHSKGPDLRNPLIFDTRDLAPGAARTLTRTVPAPEHMGVELARVPAGAELSLEIKLEGVAEGVLVTATVTGPLAGECARCLEAFSSQVKVRFQELFVLAGDTGQADDAEADDSYVLDGSGLLDLEPAVRDAIVLELPLSPLCDDSCQGLCAECGVRLADAEPGHGHEQRGTPWAALKDFRAGHPDDQRPASGPAGHGLAEHELAEQGLAGQGLTGHGAPDGKAGPATMTYRTTDAVPDQLKEQ